MSWQRIDHSCSTEARRSQLFSAVAVQVGLHGSWAPAKPHLGKQRSCSIAWVACCLDHLAAMLSGTQIHQGKSFRGKRLPTELRQVTYMGASKKAAVTRPVVTQVFRQMWVAPGKGSGSHVESLLGKMSPWGSSPRIAWSAERMKASFCALERLPRKMLHKHHFHNG